MLGVCEMGTPDRFEDFKKRLADAGLGYTDTEYVQAADADRHLALLSRFPIVSRASQTDVSFELDGKIEKVRRGFLDVTLQINPDYQLRLVGVHLKSKLPTPEGEAIVRRYEAQALRKHLDGILAANPAVNLACYGDFNDTKNEPMFQEVSGVRGAANYMADLWAKDSLGDRWTRTTGRSPTNIRGSTIFVSPGLFRRWSKTSPRSIAAPRGTKRRSPTDPRDDHPRESQMNRRWLAMPRRCSPQPRGPATRPRTGRRSSRSMPGRAGAQLWRARGESASRCAERAPAFS